MNFVKVSSWGKLSKDNHRILSLDENLHQIGIPFGNGRSYGDVCLNAQGHLWQTSSLKRFIAFDEERGLLRLQAGVLLHEINQVLENTAWMVPVTPGTAYVTVGGAIANDVHGKNHHQYGTFGRHIQRIKLMRSNGDIIDCSEKNNAEYFQATIGGLGLTGLILDVDIQLKPKLGPWFLSESIPFYSLAEFFSINESSLNDWEYTVAWVDCIKARDGHRGIFFRANPCDHQACLPKRKAFKVPFSPPFSLINPLSLMVFNQAYFHQYARKGHHQHVQDYQSFFYPLDGILNWNNIYGKKGFYQYQLVLPKATSERGISKILNEISKSKQGSFLAVLKTFGKLDSSGMLSFPMEGTTLALDFPNHGKKTLDLFARLNKIVKDAKGRIYPAKDACMPTDLWMSGYPRYDEFLKYRDEKMSSNFSRRVLGI